jgi:hypothetical protein
VAGVEIGVDLTPRTPVAQGWTESPDGDAWFELEPGTYKITGIHPEDGSRFNSPAARVSCAAETAKTIRQIVTMANGRSHPARGTVREGSRLLVIEPEWIEWTGDEERYPFIFESLGQWSVSTYVMPPEGFEVDRDSRSVDVSTETKALQFIVRDVDSGWVHSEVRHAIVHGARHEVIRSRIGVRLSRDLARAEGVDRFGRPLKRDGRPQPGWGTGPGMNRSAYRDGPPRPRREMDPREEWPVEIAGWVIQGPVDPDWQIRVRVNKRSHFRLFVTDARGRRVRLLAREKMRSGEYLIPWDGTDTAGRALRPGDYFLHLSTEAFADVVWFHSVE